MNKNASVQEQKPNESQEKDIERGLGTSMSNAQTKGHYIGSNSDGEGAEWGIVHLYRDASETPGLYKDNLSHSLGADLRDMGNGTPVPRSKVIPPLPPARDEDCTTLCILAVPSYLTPADFLAFVGEKTRDQVSHFRMIRTSRQNRYMVLMKFNNGKRAREWQSDWNGRVFNSMEPETVHVVFLKSVEIVPATITTNIATNNPEDDSTGPSTFPTILDDPFVSSSVITTGKPVAPRTPSLIELPTCPVCLERMDETTGLLTILCQHVFHCTCLQKWSGGGCPVCRYTHDDFSTRVNRGGHKHKIKSKLKDGGMADEYDVSDDPLKCEVCQVDTSLWQCLICGKVGCGRYEGKHAYKHFEETGHNFSMDLESKRVWDYLEDCYVHRIIQDAANSNEKLVELPGRRRETTALEDVDEDLEVAKMENIAVEYTHLVTSQLESQRVYFEEIVERAVDKASEANRQAERAAEECEQIRLQLQKLSIERDELIKKRIPELETAHSRLEKRAAKFEGMVKDSNRKYDEEKTLGISLMQRIEHLKNTELKTLEEKIHELEIQKATQNLLIEGYQYELNDANAQISAQRQLGDMIAKGELDPEELVGATIEVGPAPVVKKGQASKRKDNDGSSIAQQSAVSEDELTQEVQTLLGLNVGQYQKGQGWDNDTASKLFADFKLKLLEEGLLVEKTTDVAETSASIDQLEGDTETAETSTTTKKKKKGRSKKRFV